MEKPSTRPGAAVRSDAELDPVFEGRQQLIEKALVSVCQVRSAWHLKEDLRNVGWVALLSIAKPGQVPFCRKFVEWAMLTYLRKERRQTYAEMSGDPLTADLSPEQQAVYAELVRLGGPVITEISAGYSQAEIAAKSGVSQGQISRRLKKAVERIKNAA